MESHIPRTVLLSFQQFQNECGTEELWNGTEHYHGLYDTWNVIRKAEQSVNNDISKENVSQAAQIDYVISNIPILKDIPNHGANRPTKIEEEGFQVLQRIPFLNELEPEILNNTYSLQFVGECDSENFTMIVPEEKCESSDILAPKQCPATVGAEKEVGKSGCENMRLTVPEETYKCTATLAQKECTAEVGTEKEAGECDGKMKENCDSVSELLEERFVKKALPKKKCKRRQRFIPVLTDISWIAQKVRHIFCAAMKLFMIILIIIFS